MTGTNGIAALFLPSLVYTNTMSINKTDQVYIGIQTSLATDSRKTKEEEKKKKKEEGKTDRQTEQKKERRRKFD